MVQGNREGSVRRTVARLKEAMDASDEEGAVRALMASCVAGAQPDDIKRAILTVMAQDGGELHSLLYTSAAFDLADALGADAACYPLAAASVQIARQPKDSLVAEAVASPLSGATAQSLDSALEEGDAVSAVGAAVSLVGSGHRVDDIIGLLTRWACRAAVVEAPAGYVTHLPLQLASAQAMRGVAQTPEERALLVGHLVYGQVELARTYRMRPVPAPEPAGAGAPEEAARALTAAVRDGDLGGVRAAMAALSTRPRFVEDAGRALLKCGLAAEGPLSHRFTLAEAARQLAGARDVPGAAMALEAAALSIANGYRGPKRIAGLRELPLPRPGSTDYAGRLLVGVSSNRRSEAHAALRGFFENGTSPRQVALAFASAAGHFDASELHSDHPFIVLQSAWRSLKDGFFAADAVPLFVELSNRLCDAPMDHELIAAVEEAGEAARKNA